MKNVDKKAKIIKIMFNILKNLKAKIQWNTVLIILGIITFGLYLLTSAGQTPYDYFIRLADSFLHGKYYLSTNEPWLNELIPIANNKFAVVYPPTPAIIALPFVAIFGVDFEQQILSGLMGSLAAYLWGLITYQQTKNKVSSLWIFILAAFGNIMWYLSATGSVWYLGQVSGFLFLTLTIYESLNKKRPWLVPIYFGLAILSRIQLALSFPIILYLNRIIFNNKKQFFIFTLELVFFGIMFGFYNYLRFGSFTQTGYSLIPGVLDEPWYTKGIFHYSYISANLKAMFLSLPNFKNEFPYITPSWGGLSILITSPVFIYAFMNKIKNKENIFTWISILLITTIVLIHGGTGFTQFGYRYAVDFYPFILFLVLKSIAKSGIRWHHNLLLTFSVIVNLWGVIFINKFGFVSF